MGENGRVRSRQPFTSHAPDGCGEPSLPKDRTAAENRPCLKTGQLRGAVPAFLDNRLILTRMTAGGTGEWVENGGPE